MEGSLTHGYTMGSSLKAARAQGSHVQKKGSENMYDLGPELMIQEIPESEQRLWSKAGALAGLGRNPHTRVFIVRAGEVQVKYREKCVVTTPWLQKERNSGLREGGDKGSFRSFHRKSRSIS